MANGEDGVIGCDDGRKHADVVDLDGGETGAGNANLVVSRIDGFGAVGSGRSACDGAGLVSVLVGDDDIRVGEHGSGGVANDSSQDSFAGLSRDLGSKKGTDEDSKQRQEIVQSRRTASSRDR